MAKSDDEIISSIVDLLQKEKTIRTMKNSRDDQRKQNDSETEQHENEEKRKKRHNKKRKKETHERKHKVRTGKHDKENITKRIYKKDHLGRVMADGEASDGDDDDDENNLMQEDVDFRENNGSNDE